MKLEEILTQRCVCWSPLEPLVQYVKYGKLRLGNTNSIVSRRRGIFLELLWVAITQIQSGGTKGMPLALSWAEVGGRCGNRLFESVTGDANEVCAMNQTIHANTWLVSMIPLFSPCAPSHKK